jgi:hypothetical protein
LGVRKQFALLAAPIPALAPAQSISPGHFFAGGGQPGSSLRKTRGAAAFRQGNPWIYSVVGESLTSSTVANPGPIAKRRRDIV